METDTASYTTTSVVDATFLIAAGAQYEGASRPGALVAFVFAASSAESTAVLSSVRNGSMRLDPHRLLEAHTFVRRELATMGRKK